MDGDNNSTIMKLYGISLTRNGQIENNQFMNSITNIGHVTWDESGHAIDTVDPNAAEYFVGFPVPIPSGTGSWFENVTQNKVDTTGLVPKDTVGCSYWSVSDEGGHLADYFGPIVPELKYGFDPQWNVEDNTVYLEIYDQTYKGFPKPLNEFDVMYFKNNTTLAKRIIAIYNDSDTPLTNVIVKITDQTLKGAVCEIYQFNDPFDNSYYTKNSFSIKESMMNNMAFLDLIKTDGVNYGPDYAKFWFVDDKELASQTPYVHEQINISNLGAAGTKEAWAFAVITQYVTVENGNYAGTDDDYMVISTETNAY
jgi:hypothetical protein